MFRYYLLVHSSIDWWLNGGVFLDKFRKYSEIRHSAQSSSLNNVILWCLGFRDKIAKKSTDH